MFLDMPEKEEEKDLPNGSLPQPAPAEGDRETIEESIRKHEEKRDQNT